MRSKSQVYKVKHYCYSLFLFPFAYCTLEHSKRGQIYSKTSLSVQHRLCVQGKLKAEILEGFLVKKEQSHTVLQKGVLAKFPWTCKLFFP